MCGPRSLRIRMWIGIWPPSRALIFALAPERAPAPLWPRPEVLPMPEPSPRPTRLRALRSAGGGLQVRAGPPGLLGPGPASRVAVTRCSSAQQRIIGPHQVADLAAACPCHDLRRVPERTSTELADATQSQWTRRTVPLSVALVGAVGRHLTWRRHLHAARPATRWSRAGRLASIASSAAPARRRRRPRTEHAVDGQATQLGDLLGPAQGMQAGDGRLHEVDRVLRARTTWLSTSRMPASSSTARTPPPAITPVPSAEAGFRSTRPGAEDAQRSGG